MGRNIDTLLSESKRRGLQSGPSVPTSGPLCLEADQLFAQGEQKQEQLAGLDESEMQPQPHGQHCEQLPAWQHSDGCTFDQDIPDSMLPLAVVPAILPIA
jgi:hypothetical protein